MLNVDKETIARQLGECIWDFKIGDNIAFNLKILFTLYSARGTDTNHVFNKPIVISVVSLIEALLVDLLYHLDAGTNDLPPSISREKIQQIKTRINSQKVEKEGRNSLDGSTFTYLKIKNYNFKEILILYKDFALLGPLDDSIYKDLESFSWLRNRIHIPNYHNNFERDEAAVFTDGKLEAIEKTFLTLLENISMNYPRNLSQIYKDSNAQNWLEVFR